MADLGYTFDSSKVKPAEGFDGQPIPVGKYIVAMTDSEKVDTKKGDGWMLKCTFTVLEGDYKNRKLWHQLNLQNPSSVAVEIAQAELSAIFHAVGVGATGNSQDLHDRPMVVNVVTENKKDKETGEYYGPRNKITKFMPLAGAVAGSIAPRAASPVAAKGTAPAWAGNRKTG